MVKIFRRPLPILVAALAISCVLTAFWILKLEWTLPWLRLFDRPDSLPLDALMVQNNTLPRMAMALLAGGSTAMATMLMQQLMRNPLASDSTLAVSSGAQAALVAATVFAPSFLAYGTSAVAFAGAAAALGAVLRLSARRALQPLSVVLAGLVVSLYLGSLTGIVMLFFSEETRGVMQWGSGSLVQDSWRDTLGLLWRIAVAAILTAFLIKPLNIMSLGDTQAESAGIPVKKIRLLSLAVAAFLSAGVVGFVGMMGFVGLAAATLVRQMGVRTLSMRLICSFIVGALLLMLTDNGLMLLKHYRGTDLPAGAVTALVGAPLLLWLTAKAPPRPSFQTTSDISTAAPHVPRLLHFLLLIAVAVSVLAFTVGRYDETLRLTIDPEYFVFRYPRVLLAAATGTMLALTGVILQRLTQNPMAGPELLGISSGTAFGAMSVVMLFGITSGSGWFWLTGIVSALVSLGLLMLFNRKNGFTPEKILLTGMALAALADAAIRIWMATGDFRVQLLLLWMSGSTYQATPESALTVGLLAAASLLLILTLQRWLGLLSLNPTIACSVGINVPLARLVLIVSSAALTALSTLLIGPLSFVGLLAPHLARMLGARLPKQQLAAAALIGASVMMMADWLGRQVMFPYEVPAGMMATLIGGAYFMMLMRKL
ncbi:Fe(3+)-hydroxamate ABC transporter permease FhuB [Neisseria sicca]|uniref:Fe(3+)-hydroxamate ABC transporter permease FhuB n=1 Tax=Neisseria sicca TaxID=490 RepID=A0A2I1XBX4_NEISI|nr:Fe(3+)-hydroxamate ABC transporter permease FhuB [Neisseria sicca]PLA40144.1 Fe(3+)-hydroxamate ABC transporter permease FhuB [Neisseria sicca]